MLPSVRRVLLFPGRVSVNSADVSTNMHRTTQNNIQHNDFRRFSTTYLHHLLHLPVCSCFFTIRGFMLFAQRGRLILQTGLRASMAVQLNIRSGPLAF